ncbi:MAG: DUF3422 domain-containing protein [Methylobacteriaceae bacterium]|nr:DUF3422 domain-containing protein [Methylobacteriaceae bacterium]
MTDANEPLALAAHPLRAQVLAELHARPFTPIATPSRVLRFGFTADASTAKEATQALIALCQARGLQPPPPDARHFTGDLGEGRLRFERHNEFVTYTWEFPTGSEAFQPPADVLGRAMALVPQPGPLIVAIDMHIVRADSVPDFNSAFAGANVVASDVEDDRALIATDFLPDADGFVRILILDKQLTPISAGALAQRLLEIETYRTLALLGLPEAQRCLPIIERIDGQLPALMRDVQDGRGFETNRALLDRLTALAAEVEAQAAETSFRFGATRAYDELVTLRIEAIKENHLPHHSTLASFLSRRMAPAVRTCATVEKRLGDLSAKIARLAELLRTRVDIELESQNALQLRQMGERVRLQLRLQQTVEGLSIAAITYYVASLFHLIFDGLHARGWPVEPVIATALMLPFIIAAVGFTVWRIRHRHRAD